MPAIAMGLGWAGYTLALWGYCLITGKNITLGELVNPRTILNWSTAIQASIPDTQVLPGPTAAPSSNTGSSSSGGSSGPGGGIDGPGSSGGCPPGYYLIGGHCVKGAAE